MKSRQPVLHWLLIVATLGQYAFFWIFLLARDANLMAGAERIPIRKHALVFGILWSIYFVGFFATALTPIQNLDQIPPYVIESMVFLAIAMLGYFFWLLFTVANVFRLEKIQGIPTNSALFGYSLLYLSSLPVLQSIVNKGSTHKATTPAMRASVSDL